jgi:thymidylate synthase
MEIIATTKLSAWHGVVRHVAGYPVTTDERGEKVRQAPGVVLVKIMNPWTPVSWPKWSFAAGPGIRRYTEELFNADKGGFEYTYVERLGYQIEVLGDHCKNTGATRRLAYSILKEDDLLLNNQGKAMPCWIAGAFEKNGERLNHTAYYRSWDVIGGMPANLEALTAFGEHVARLGKMLPGWLCVVAMNAHIRGDDFDRL